MLIAYYISIIIILILLLILIIKKIYYRREEFMEYNKIDKNKFNIYHYDKNCLTRCGNITNCTMLKYQDENYNKCIECNKDKTNVFTEEITGYTCNSYNPNIGNKSINCNKNEGLSCPNYDNIASPTGIRPYYIMQKEDNKLLNSEKCKFCWTID